ncbi:MAG: sulfite exporter TauE/SafE family protein [Ferrovibrio sp.]|jgi:sulfite exporter TauE/SafE|uniref:sulfite exporter TauE/SafE family protein n=1 Tax=Ferrovibrio sp. TaxID=1917215 RepID=UPI003919922D
MFDWSAFLSACSAIVHGDAAPGVFSYGLPLGLLMLGFIGGFTHCAGMCGPFVLAQVGSRLAATDLSAATRLTRLQGMTLVPYHLGRATTYAALGGLAGGLSGGLQGVSALSRLPGFALSIMALLFLGMAVFQWTPRMAFAGGGLSAGWQRLFSPLFSRPVGLTGYALGLGLGFLPCGLVYAALLMAGASGDWRMGAAGMAAFAAGTVPALLVVGMLGVAAGHKLRQKLRFWLIPILLFNAVLAGLMAWRWFAA